MLIAFYTVISVLGLMAYATVGFTIFRIHLPAIYEKCRGDDHLKFFGHARLGPYNHPDRHKRDSPCTQQKAAEWFAVFCVVWPAMLPFALVALAAKGPSHWSALIANEFEHRRTAAPQLQRMTPEELHAKEIELGLTEENGGIE